MRMTGLTQAGDQWYFACQLQGRHAEGGELSPWAAVHEEGVADFAGTGHIRRAVQNRPLHPQRRRAAAVEIEEVGEVEAPGERLHFGEVHPGAELRLAAVHGEEPDAAVAVDADRGARVTRLGEAGCELLGGPLRQIRALAGKQPGASDDVARGRPGLRRI